MIAMTKAYTPVEIALFNLLRSALGVAENVSVHFSPEEWQKLYALSKQQSVTGLVCAGVKKLPKDQLPPRALLLRWATDTEAIRGMNGLINKEAARLTAIFDRAGRKTAILKGPANARLYPDPGCRQCGDIDLWVEGGRKSVGKLLYQLKLIDSMLEAHVAWHHIHLPRTKDGIVTEVHFKTASAKQFSERALEKYLTNEILKSELVPEGFYAPSIKFALVMQLSHLQQHIFSSGIGLRHYADYMVLLIHSTESDRKEAAAVIKSLYMGHTCAAVMWLLGEVFGLSRERMLCEPDVIRGKRIFDLAMQGGNFGRIANKHGNAFMQWLASRKHKWSWVTFDPLNVICSEFKYFYTTITLIPVRIKQGRIKAHFE